jgi:type IX secretion system PorP/SprF family membrane protein
VIAKKIIGLFIGGIYALVATAQDFHFSGFMQNMVYVNPAYATLPDVGEAGITYRNQWPGIPATFVTYGASLIFPVKSLNSGVGLSILNDMQGSGVINRTWVNLLYGYVFEVNRNWQVGAGISASYVLKRFDGNELVFRSDILNDLGYSYGTVTFDNYTRSYPDFSVGIIAKNSNNISFGFSVSHVTRPHDSFSDVINSRLPFKYTAFISGRISGGRRNNRGGISVEPALFFSQQQKNNELIWGSQFNLASNFMLGGWIRHNVNFKLDALIISSGFSWEKYNIYYSYDVNLKKINYLSTKMAAHEVTFLYRFEYKDEYRGKRSKKAFCPAYD